VGVSGGGRFGGLRWIGGGGGGLDGDVGGGCSGGSDFTDYFCCAGHVIEYKTN
jgi:hypothetical protein